MSKPFIKWAGGKTQLLGEIDKRLPREVLAGGITTYIEPFVGGGALFFHLAAKAPFKRAVLIDINPELILMYTVVKEKVEKLIKKLNHMGQDYLACDDEGRRSFFDTVRDSFNNGHGKIDFSAFGKGWIQRAAQFIFLNRTCFNGLYRVNSKGRFNVPHGRYKNPTICDAERLRTASALLGKATLVCGSYTDSARFANAKSFIYFDPPYRPLTKSAMFTSYTKFDFDDDDQIALGRYYAQLAKNGTLLMLSNSDPKNVRNGDSFFDELYRGFNIHRVKANRMINSDASKRGKIAELLITNY